MSVLGGRYEGHMHISTWVGFALVGMLALTGCGDDHHTNGGEHHGAFSDDCQAIIDVCHDVDGAYEGEIGVCHEDIAHENDVDLCTSEKDRCIALCVAAGGVVPNGDDAGQD